MAMMKMMVMEMMMMIIMMMTRRKMKMMMMKTRVCVTVYAGADKFAFLPFLGLATFRYNL